MESKGERLQVEFQLNEDDLWSLAKDYLTVMPGGRFSTRKWKNSLVLCNVLLLGLIALPSLSTGRITADIWFPIAILLAMNLWMLYFRYRGLPKSMCRNLRSGQNRVLLANTRLTCTPEGIETQTEFGDSKLKWRGVEDIVKRDDHLYLVLGASISQMIPKRAIGNDGMFQQFYEQIHRWWKESEARGKERT